MENQINIPDKIQEQLNKILALDEQIYYVQDSNLTLDKKFGQSHLIVTNQNIFVFDSHQLATTIKLKGIKKIKVIELFNHSKLIAVGKKDQQNIIYYSKTNSPQFGTIVRLTNQYLSKTYAQVYHPEKDQITHCSKCHHPLPERGGICPQCLPKWTILLRLLSYLKPYKLISAGVLFFTTIMVISQLIPPYITKKIVDDVLEGRQHEQFNFWIMAMLIAGLIYFISSFLSGIYSSWLATRLVTDFRNLLYHKILGLKLTYFDKHTSGELESKIEHDTSEIQHFLLDGLPFLIINSISLVIIAIILVSIDYKLSILVFLPAPFMIFGSHWFMTRLIPLFHYRGSIKDTLLTTLNETLQGIKIVKAFTQQKRHITVFEKDNQKFFDTQFSIEKTFIGFRQVMFFIMQLGIVGVWFFAGQRIIEQNGLTLGDLLAFVGYIWLFYGPLQWFTQILNWMTHALASTERMFSILDMTSEPKLSPQTKPGKITKGKIEFKNVRFSYEYGREAIKGISFEIQPGEMIGLVGKSGGGKSTIIHLINNFFDIDSGQILIDNQSIKDFSLTYLRSNIGMVMQEPFLFNTSILENIRYGRPDASFDKIVQAAKAAHAHEFIINKEKGYDTIIGEKGVRLSGGEKQRLSIARAILQNPPILILDEATSSVDVQTERMIQKALEKLIKNRTTIAIAHRLSTLRNANRLLYIENGKIVETGTHNELIRKKGKYNQLVKLQTQLSKF
ncbi:ABC transporter ATP-binding protein/permease, partial [Patescibacteria group bacterium]|nr:ABC transporter ATP-binding protein/permease [Patescibacteria group bacterium]